MNKPFKTEIPNYRPLFIYMKGRGDAFGVHEWTSLKVANWPKGYTPPRGKVFLRLLSLG